MKRSFKLLFNILIIFLITFSPFLVRASESKTLTEFYNSDIKLNSINKRYYNESSIVKNKNLCSDTDKQQGKKIIVSYNNNYCTNIDQIEEMAKDNILNKNTNFLIHYTGNLSDLLGSPNFPKKVVNYVIAYDNYAGYCVTNCITTFYGYDKNIDIKFDVTYLLTHDEEIWVDNKVDSILQNIISNSMTQDQKEKAIHDYIVANVAYDETAKKNNPYYALHDGKTMCQGYALLACKMLSKVNIKNLLVLGSVDGSSTYNHIWNLVNLNGKWYHLDCTWDDPIPDIPNRRCYNYYNLTDDELAKDHDWEMSKYPFADTKYDLSLTNIPVKAVELDKHKITLKVGETTSLTASVLPSNASNNSIKWNFSAEGVIYFDGKTIKGVKPGTVYVNALSNDGTFKDTCIVTVTNEIADPIDINDSTQLQEKINVDKDKSWKIRFNKNISTSALNKDNVFILDEFNNKVDINLRFDVNKDTLIVEPLKNYISGKTYYLVINKKIYSDSGKTMIKNIIMKFSIK
ncbi:transglutaminase domain-containing protein [Clostridium sp. JS66]|uniref:transglutaminase domain-containing protein n=1 Tax=Clostridium sp. JS66 TaxID=3064705 RepID=UPI00298E5EC3|nr:transglutaminase domain-containing protein [Clostridium sp. JS66]WPC42334.1 Ig-like domain-containing protein [Clostridium sp. JS66]